VDSTNTFTVLNNGCHYRRLLNFRCSAGAGSYLMHRPDTKMFANLVLDVKKGRDLVMLQLLLESMLTISSKVC